MSEKPVISVRNISKAYRIWNSPAARLSSPLLKSASQFFPEGSWARRRLEARSQATFRDFWALRDVSFDVHPGESFGIIGRNGSGKSTLLQIIAGTLRPTLGTAVAAGRVAAMLELGSGFNPDFTGRENIYLNAAVLGLSRSEVDARYDQIAAFADIGDFIDQPVKTYSSGMFVRLAFAVQTAVNPQILIVDEALSVGDVFFQQRCYERMRQLLDAGVCVVLASHDLGSVQQFCRNTLVLHQSHLAFSGPSAQATKIYFQIEQQEKISAFSLKSQAEDNISASPAEQITTTPISNWPQSDGYIATDQTKIITNGWAQCTALAVCNSRGETCFHFKQGETMVIFYEFEILKDMEFCFGCITIRDRTAQAIHSKITLQDGVRQPERVTAGTRLRYRQDTILNLACLDYTFDVALEMITADLLVQPGITYDQFMGSQIRVCELHSAASFTVRLRNETTPFQLLHFGAAGLPSESFVEIVPLKK